MKSYNHLWEKFVSTGNIVEAIKNAVKGKRNRRDVKKLLNDPDGIKHIKDYAEHFHNMKHTPVQIYDGIQRRKRERNLCPL